MFLVLHFQLSTSLRGAKRRGNLPRYCQALLGVGDGGSFLPYFYLNTSLRTSAHTGVAISPFTALWAVWGMVDFLFELPYFPRHCEGIYARGNPFPLLPNFVRRGEWWILAALPLLHVIARAFMPVAIRSPYCQALLGVGDGGLPFRTSVLSTSLRGAKRRGNLPVTKLCLVWGMVDFLFELPYFPRHCEERKRRGNLPFYGPLGRVGDGGFDLHFSFPQRE